jgi:hypothetical protein
LLPTPNPDRRFSHWFLSPRDRHLQDSRQVRLCGPMPWSEIESQAGQLWYGASLRSRESLAAAPVEIASTIVHQERAAVTPNNTTRRTYTWLVILRLVLVAALSVGAIGYGVRVDVMRMTADVGIPGVTTSYSVKLRNHTALPMTFEGVQLPGGYPASGVWHHYRIEKRDTKAKTWRTVVEVNPTTMGDNPVVTKRRPHHERGPRQPTG